MSCRTFLPNRLEKSIARCTQKKVVRSFLDFSSQPDFPPRIFYICYAYPHSLEICSLRWLSSSLPSWPSSSQPYPFLAEPLPCPSATLGPSSAASPPTNLTPPLAHSSWARLASLSRIWSPLLVSTATPSPLAFLVALQAVVLSGKLFSVYFIMTSKLTMTSPAPPNRSAVIKITWVVSFWLICHKHFFSIPADVFVSGGLISNGCNAINMQMV
jgi:hypothetical protein